MLWSEVCRRSTTPWVGAVVVAALLLFSGPQLDAQERAEMGALFEEGVLLLQQGNPAEASSWLQRALYIDPDHFEAHVLMAEAREEAGDLEGAVLHLWEARRLDDGANSYASPDYRERLASLYVRLLAAADTTDE